MSEEIDSHRIDDGLAADGPGSGAEDEIGIYDLLDAEPDTLGPGRLPDSRPLVARKGYRPIPTETTVERQRLCPACGYDMRGLTHDTCPECGGEYIAEGYENDPFAAHDSIWHWFSPLRWIVFCTLPMLLVWMPLGWLATTFGGALGAALAGMIGVVGAIGLAAFASMQA
jgi:hypothetical protein